MQQILNIMKNKSYQIPGFIFENYKKLKITEKELIVLIYLYNNLDTDYNPKNICLVLNMKLEQVLEIISNLEDKNILKIDCIDENKVRYEKVNLDLLFEKCAYMLEPTNDNKDVFTKYEKELGRSLSPMEYEIITKWLEDYDEELIILALKEAIYNGTNNFRYIDRIIFEWHKKGIKTEKDVINMRKEYKKSKDNKELFDYDWLNESKNN